MGFNIKKLITNNIKLNGYIRMVVPDSIWIPFSSKVAYYLYLNKYYTNSNEDEEFKPIIIYMADGKVIHGGLADRIKGMLSLYLYSKSVDSKFGIFFNHPFNLSDYLVPNEVDWNIDHNLISYSSNSSKAFIIKQSKLEPVSYIHKQLDNFVNKYQLHIYTNLPYHVEMFNDAFYKLFKPSSELQAVIDKNLDSISSEYISVTLRFQHLLGDFKEASFKESDDSTKHYLIDKCLDFIYNVHSEHSNKKVLVTSDSTTFLDIAKQKHSFVYVIPGEVYHIDYSSRIGHLPYLKSFVDFFMLTKSQHLYSYSVGDMYPNSGFARLAAIIGKKEFTRVIE